VASARRKRMAPRLVMGRKEATGAIRKDDSHRRKRQQALEKRVHISKRQAG
jgi:hypothetical protein